MSVAGLKLTKIAAVTLTLALGAVATSAPASADDDGWRHRRHHDRYVSHHDRYVDYRYAPPPRYYYAPPPRVVYVQPRPAYYYAPPPVVYAPPPVISFGFIFGR